MSPILVPIFWAILFPLKPLRSQRRTLSHLFLQEAWVAPVIRKVKVSRQSFRVSLKQTLAWRGSKYLKKPKFTIMTSDFVCNICGKQFKSQKTLTQHNRDVHSEEDIPCTSCDKTFRTKKHLAYHFSLLWVHTFTFLMCRASLKDQRVWVSVLVDWTRTVEDNFVRLQ